jgi:regulator of extracellular matrix RemA (YlzA/DUF370 family)
MANEMRPNALTPLLNVGFYNFVLTHKIVALVRCDSAPIKRLVQQLRHEGTRLIDATQGRRTRCVIFLESGQVVLSALSQETLAKRLLRSDLALSDDEKELIGEKSPDSAPNPPRKTPIHPLTP